MKKILPILCLTILFLSCEGHQPRRPVEVKSGSFLKLSAQRNKNLLQMEESLMDELAAQDSLHEYLMSSSGFRYFYNKQLPAEGYRPRPDDLVTLTYNLRTWNEDTLYTQEEIGIIRYKVDKQDLVPGLRYSVKLLKKGETATFLFPSSLAYGYHGDDNRIGPKVPIKATLEILDIEPQRQN